MENLWKTLGTRGRPLEDPCNPWETLGKPSGEPEIKGHFVTMVQFRGRLSFSSASAVVWLLARTAAAYYAISTCLMSLRRRATLAQGPKWFAFVSHPTRPEGGWLGGRQWRVPEPWGPTLLCYSGAGLAGGDPHALSEHPPAPPRSPTIVPNLVRRTRVLGPTRHPCLLLRQLNGDIRLWYSRRPN